jgi:hypothetical protein
VSPHAVLSRLGEGTSRPRGVDLVEEPRRLAHVDPSCQWQHVGLGGAKSPYVPQGGVRKVGVVPRAPVSTPACSGYIKGRTKK